MQRPKNKNKQNKQEFLLRSHQTTKSLLMYIDAKYKEYTINWKLQQ
jgi:hypothetical protein